MHPTSTLIARLGLIVLAASGCQNQQGVAGNPFASASPADRVPPPATRLSAPVVSQPYYQGAVARPADNTLAVAPAQPPVTQPPAALDITAAPAVASYSRDAQGSISLPSDNQPLRFPSTAAQEEAALAATPAAAAPLHNTFATPAPARGQEPATQSPEFSPLDSQPTLAWGAGAPASMVAAPAAYPSATPVLQASYESISPGTPRVRLPGYATPVSYTAPAAAPTGPVGQVQITELPPPTAYAAPRAAESLGDGFQPRGATPRRTPTPDLPSVL